MQYWLFLIVPLVSNAFSPLSLQIKPGSKLYNSISKHPNPIIPSSSSSKNFIDNSKNILDFGRPHTLIGTGISIFSTFRFANPHSFPLASFFWVLGLCSMMNLYITGINQVYDLSIDKINKPNLVLPSGRIDKKNAKLISLLALFSSLLLSLLPISLNRIPLFLLLSLSAILGTLYSVPPFRLKVNPLSALFCIVCVRGIFIPSLIYLYACQNPLQYIDILKISGSVFYFSILSILIAIMKDIPDHKGDLIHGIGTFTLHYGSSRIMSVSKNIHRLLSLLAGILFLINVYKKFNILLNIQIITRIIISLIFWGFFIKSPFSNDYQEKSYKRLWDFFYFSYTVLIFL